MLYLAQNTEVESIYDVLYLSLCDLVDYYAKKHPILGDKFEDLKLELYGQIDEAEHNDLTLAQLEKDIDDQCQWIIDPPESSDYDPIHWAEFI